MLKKNIGTFKGFIDENDQKCVIFNGIELDPQLELFNHSRVGLDWGYSGSGALQLSFAILYRVAGDDAAKTLRTLFSREIISKLEKEWEFSSKFVKKWVAENKNVYEDHEFDIYTDQVPANNQPNVVKKICQELDITQKKLAKILEIPEGTVSSWAVRNELPRLAKKAIEFYIDKQRNDKIVKQFRDLIALVS